MDDLKRIPSAKGLFQVGPFKWRNPLAYPSYSRLIGVVPVVRFPVRVGDAGPFPPIGFAFLQELEGFGLSDILELFLTNEITLQYRASLSPFHPGEQFGRWGELVTVDDAANGYIILDDGYNFMARFGVTYTITMQFFVRYLQYDRTEIMTVRSGRSSEPTALAPSSRSPDVSLHRLPPECNVQWHHELHHICNGMDAEV